MLNLFKVFVEIALWRKGPQDLPASSLLLLAAIVAYFVVGLLLSNAVPRPDDRLLVRTVLEVGVGLGWIWVLLALFRRQGRFRQTATAVLGTTALLAPLVIGLQAALVRLGPDHMLTVPVVLVLLTIFIWYLLVTAHIVRAALEVNLFAAVLLTLLYMSCEYLVTERLLNLTA